MVNLTRIYTRTGDDGTTSSATWPDPQDRPPPRRICRRERDQRRHRRRPSGPAWPRTSGHAGRVQNDLFDVGADLSTPLQVSYEHPPLRVRQRWVDELEADCDAYLERLDPAAARSSFPAARPAAAQLHVATTVARRAERSTWAAIEAYGTEPGSARGEGGVNPLAATYLNRLSDLLFILARVANLPSGDVLWQPGGGRPSADPR